MEFNNFAASYIDSLKKVLDAFDGEAIAQMVEAVLEAYSRILKKAVAIINPVMMPRSDRPVTDKIFKAMRSSSFVFSNARAIIKPPKNK